MSEVRLEAARILVRGMFRYGQIGRTQVQERGGKATPVACPNARSHKLNLFKWAQALPKRLAQF
jgi:hypothetical protein